MSNAQYPWPNYPPPPANPADRHPPNGTRCLSIHEQLGTDPISKLAAAIEKLAEALREAK